MLTAREIADAVLSGRPIPAEDTAIATTSDGAVEMKLCEGYHCGRNFVRAAIGPKETRKRLCAQCELKAVEKRCAR